MYLFCQIVWMDETLSCVAVVPCADKGLVPAKLEPTLLPHVVTVLRATRDHKQASPQLFYLAVIANWYHVHKLLICFWGKTSTPQLPMRWCRRHQRIGSCEAEQYFIVISCSFYWGISGNCLCVPRQLPHRVMQAWLLPCDTDRIRPQIIEHYRMRHSIDHHRRTRHEKSSHDDSVIYLHNMLHFRASMKSGYRWHPWQRIHSPLNEQIPRNTTILHMSHQTRFGLCPVARQVRQGPPNTLISMRVAFLIPNAHITHWNPWLHGVLLYHFPPPRLDKDLRGHDLHIVSVLFILIRCLCHHRLCHRCVATHLLPTEIHVQCIQYGCCRCIGFCWRLAISIVTVQSK